MKKFFLFSTLLFLVAFVQAQQDSFNYHVSNAGNDAGAGTINSPKRTIAGVTAAISNAAVLPSGSLKIGLHSGDTFNETFFPGYPVSTGTYFPSGGKNFAVLKGSKDFNSGWVMDDSSNTYRQQIPLHGAFRGYGINNIGSYSYVYVFEIDRQLELTAPITARRMLQFMRYLPQASAMPGSFYEPTVSSVDSITVFIHTSDGISPNHHPKYRYEVSIRDWAVNSTYQQNNHFERLWMMGFGAGNGMAPAGANTTFNRMIFGPGAGIHHLGIRGGIIDNSLFLPGPKNTNGYAVVFYDVQGYRRHNIIRNSIFMDIKYPVYAHKSTGVDFAALELDNVIAFADTTEAVAFAECANTDSVILSNVYSDKYLYGYNLARARSVSIKNSVFKDVKMGVFFPGVDLSATLNNNYIRVSNFKNGERGYGIAMSSGNRVIISNNIIHLKKMEPLSTALAGYLLSGSSNNSCYTSATGNIFICEVAPGNYAVAAYSNTNNGAGTSNDLWRNNVYILLSGSKLEWRVTNSATNQGRYEVSSLEQWRIQSGQDANSLFFDLRNDPRGLKAIFVDPDNGDYTLANTFEGNQVKEIRAGMVNPITCFLKRPTYEEAARIIMNDGVLTANACRQPCNQSNIRIDNHLSTSISGNKNVWLQWNIADESAVDHYEIMRSFGNNDFGSIASIPAETNFNYSYTDSNLPAGITYRYSVALITKLKEKCYSQVSVIKTDDSRAINVYPNPSRGKIFLGLNAYTGPVKIAIYNVVGRSIYSKEMNAVYGIPVQVDLSAEAKGFYWINVQTDGTNVQHGFVLQ